MSLRSIITVTKKHVDAMVPGQTIWDEKIRGFGVRCQVHDKSFVLKCLVKGRQRFITIGKYGSPWTVDSARRQALALLSDVHKGLDPAEARRQDRLRANVAELCSRYLREHARVNKKPSSSSTTAQSKTLITCDLTGATQEAQVEFYVKLVDLADVCGIKVTAPAGLRALAAQSIKS